jgi:hypothetical protein
MEELLSMAGNMKMPVENRPGDNAILRVIEAYCAGGGRGGAVRKSPYSVCVYVWSVLAWVLYCMFSWKGKK